MIFSLSLITLCLSELLSQADQKTAASGKLFESMPRKMGCTGKTIYKPAT